MGIGVEGVFVVDGIFFGRPFEGGADVEAAGVFVLQLGAVEVAGDAGEAAVAVGFIAIEVK